METPAIVLIGRDGVLLDRIHECPNCHAMTMFYRTYKGRTYCYLCVPEEGSISDGLDIGC
jgi:hypothetical protein